MYQDKRIFTLALFNMGLLLIAGIKDFKFIFCSHCSQNQLSWLNDMTITYAGFFATIMLLNPNGLPFFPKNKYISIVLAGFFACFACFLQVYRYLKEHAFCLICLSVTVIFYLVFIIRLLSLLSNHKESSSLTYN